MVLVALPLAGAIAILASIAAYAGRRDEQPSDAAIVLGAAIRNGKPTPVFEERLRHGIALYRRGVVPRLILTGGVGGDVIAESEAAREFCLAAGVPDGAIWIETASRTTQQNLEQARRLMDAHVLRRALIVSDPLHMRRALTMARDLGMDAHPSPTPTTRYVGFTARAQFLLREGFFYARYLLFGRA